MSVLSEVSGYILGLSAIVVVGGQNVVVRTRMITERWRVVNPFAVVMSL